MQPDAWDWQANRALYPNCDLHQGASAHQEIRMPDSSTPAPFGRLSLFQYILVHPLPWRKTRMGGKAHRIAESPKGPRPGSLRPVLQPAGARGGNGAIPDSLRMEWILNVSDRRAPLFRVLRPNESQASLRFG